MTIAELGERNRTVADSWKQEAARRRSFSKVDPVADTLEYCASELLIETQELETERMWLSTEEYAEQENVSAQSVRIWIRKGELEASTSGGSRYKIRRTAKRRKR